MRLEEFIAANQIDIRIDQFREFCSLVMWVNTSEKTSQHLLRYGLENLENEEIMSGNETWLIELCALKGTLPQLLPTLRDECLRDSPRVTYFRIKSGRRIAKRIARTDCSSFFRSAPPTTVKNSSFLQSRDEASLQLAANATQETAKSLGEVAMLAHRVPCIGNLTLSQALQRIGHPEKLQQRRLYHDADGQLCGYVSWAWLDSDLAYQGVPPPQALAPHQWNEGTCLLVCDAFATSSSFARVCADLAAGLYPGEPMHLRPDAPHRTIVQVISIATNALESLQHITDIDAPVIDILALLRKRLASHNGVHT